MVDEQEECCFLDMVIGVSGVPGGSKTPFAVCNIEGNELVGDTGAMDLPNTVYSAGFLWRGETETGIAMLLARERCTITVHCIAANDVENLGILFAWRLESLLARGYVVEEVLNLLILANDGLATFSRIKAYCDLGTPTASCWLGICTLARLYWG